MTDTDADTQDGVSRNVYTVSELNMEARVLLEENFPRIWVEGEISNLARPRSGHIYFSLKDDRCQLRCAMFRMHNRRIDFTPEDGMQVLAQGRVSLYPERGDYQLIVQFLEEAGAGALRRAFEALKQRLAGEGLFDEARKRPLPSLPRQIGVVTSPTGAALRDILSILARRFPAIPVLIYPVPVQGAGAAPEIARMLDVASNRGECDVLILARGGGSLEDLWAFNEENVARAIRRSRVPVPPRHPRRRSW
jgi:exodeoxyribonuclease VII large subunit